MKNKKNIKSIFKMALGILLIIIGIPGLVLPVLQGVLFITVGLGLIFGKSIFFKIKKIKKYLSTFFKY